MKDDKARFYMKYDEEDCILIIEVTENVAFSMMKIIRQHLWPEVERMKMKFVDVVTDEGKEYKNVRRYAIPVYKDRVEMFFDAAKAMLSKSIKGSFTNSDNWP